MIFDEIFFKVLKIKWVLIKVVGGVGAVGAVGVVGGVGVVGDSPRTREGGQTGKRWWKVVGIMGVAGIMEGGGNYGSDGSGGNYGSSGNYGSGGKWWERWELWEWWELWEQWEWWERWEWCRDLWVVGVLRETWGSWKGVGKIEIKNFAKGVAGEAIKTFGKV